MPVPRDEVQLGKRLDFDAPVEFQAAAEGDRDAPKKFSMTAYTGGAMRVGFYYSPVVIDLAGITAGNDAIPVLLGHDVSRIVGHGTAEVTAQRIKIDGVASGGGDAAREVVGAARNGFPWRASVGVVPTKREFIEEGATGKANGQNFEGPVNIIRGGVLEEVSFVPIAADRKTSAKVAAQPRKEGHSMDPIFAEWLKANGYEEPEALNEAQLKPLKAAFDAEQAEAEKAKKKPPVLPVNAGGDGATVPLDGDLTDYRKRLAEETKRAGEIEATCAQYAGRIEAEELVTIKASAIEESWSQDTLELTLLRAARPTAPAAHTRTSPEVTERVLEAAACQSLRLPDHEEGFDDKTLQAAHTHYRGELGLKELLMISARSHGYTGGHFREGDLRTILAYALPPVQAAAAQSGFSLSTILGNTANKSILAGFNGVESAWREIALIGSVNDFKTHTRIRMTGDASFEKVPADGMIAHGTLDETTYTISADTFGRMYVLDRRDIVNDDLGALNRLSGKLGRGAAIRINKEFWTTFMDNSTFFAAGNSNYVTGATYALSATDPIAALAKAEQTFMDQTDPDGDPVAVEPKILLCPTAVYAYAKELYESTAIVSGATKVKQPSKNVFAGRFRPVVSAYLGNSNYTGYSAAAWYLLADPADLAVVEVIFLNGKQTPTIESAEADFNVLGVQFRGYGDFGIGMHEYRGGVKMKGES